MKLKPPLLVIPLHFLHALLYKVIFNFDLETAVDG